MSPDDYIQLLVAHYLHEKGLSKTYSQFEHEVKKKFNISNIDESLNTIIHDRINFDKLNIIDDADDINTLDPSNQSLFVQSKDIQLPTWKVNHPNVKGVIDLGPFGKKLIINSAFWKFKNKNLGLFVTNTNYLIIYDLDSNKVIANICDPLNGKTIKTVLGIESTDYLFVCDMNGTLNLFQLNDEWQLINCLQENPKLHRRLITDFKFIKYEEGDLIGLFASIGWDSRVVVGKVQKHPDDKVTVSIINDYKFVTNPTSLIFTLDKESNLPVLLVGRLNSTLISMFLINTSYIVELSRVSLNDSDFSNHSFQPMDIIEIKNDSNNTIISIGTDHVPYMRLITIVLPSLEEIVHDKSHYPDLDNEKFLTLKSKLDHIASSNQEHVQQLHSKVPIIRNVILSNFNSLSPQDKYSNAILLARPDSMGVWIVGDDGKVRGFDINSGTIVETLDSSSGRAKSAFLGSNKSGELVVFCSALDKVISLWSS